MRPLASPPPSPDSSSARRVLFERRKLIVPPCNGLAKDIASIIAFPRAVEKRAVDVLANLPDVSEPYRRAATHRLSGELNRESDFGQRMYIAAVFLQQVVAFPLDELAEDFVLGVRAFPLLNAAAAACLINGSSLVPSSCATLRDVSFWPGWKCPDIRARTISR